jgi:two-component system CheB/CheR fusion protein
LWVYEEVQMAQEGHVIIGMGASAGGLDALMRFFAHCPVDTGFAFVIVQHMSPTREGILPELIQIETEMPVVTITDGLKTEPNSVYVIPPGVELSVLRGVLHLLKPEVGSNPKLPIDHFFRALAVDSQERAVGVILSGMGSDGVLGVRAIHEKSGFVFAQDPVDANYAGMPASAIQTGCVDMVATADELPARIIDSLAKRAKFHGQQLQVEKIRAHHAIEKIVLLLRSQIEHDFSEYKTSTITRRIERRMSLNDFKDLDAYVRYLQLNPQEVEFLFREMLIGVTSFFRDSYIWEWLRDEIIPEMLNQFSPGYTVRVWVPACATGEEAYSLAIAFCEAMEAQPKEDALKLQIFATDLDDNAIEKAREGLFPENIETDVPPELLTRYFTRVRSGYRVTKTIREKIIFATQNVIMDPPFTKLDFLSCRNLLIYLTPALQKKLLPLFHYCLKDDGVLFLGTAETIGRYSNLFESYSGKKCLYKRLSDLYTAEPVEFPTSFVSHKKLSVIEMKNTTNLERLVNQRLLDRFTPVSILTNMKGDILYINGKSGRYLEPVSGGVNWNLFLMAREGIRYSLSSAYKALSESEGRIILEKLRYLTLDQQERFVKVTVDGMFDVINVTDMVLVVFEELPTPPKSVRNKDEQKSEIVEELEDDLKRAYQETQSIREEMQSSQEELQSMNEELQSTNEELQSTNEELTTSKEELQSMNEELHTVNVELQSRLDEITRINNDMKNLLDSTDIATLFLDNDMRVRRFTTETGNVTSLIPSDIGRPITDIASPLLYQGLHVDAKKVLKSMNKFEKRVKVDDDEYVVRILPYRTTDDVVDGVVITFTNLNDSNPPNIPDD